MNRTARWIVTATALLTGLVFAGQATASAAPSAVRPLSTRHASPKTGPFGTINGNNNATCAVPDWNPDIAEDSTSTLFYGEVGLSPSCEPSYPVQVTWYNELWDDPTGDDTSDVLIATSDPTTVTLPPEISISNTGQYPAADVFDEFGAPTLIFDVIFWTFHRLDGKVYGPLPFQSECSGVGTSTLNCVDYSPEYTLSS